MPALTRKLAPAAAFELLTTGEFLLEPAVAEARRRSYRQSFDACSIERASLGNDAGLIGAASWARMNLLAS